MDNRVEQLERTVRRLKLLLLVCVGLTSLAIAIGSTTGFMLIRANTANVAASREQLMSHAVQIDATRSLVDDIQERLEVPGLIRATGISIERDGQLKGYFGVEDDGARLAVFQGDAQVSLIASGSKLGMTISRPDGPLLALASLDNSSVGLVMFDNALQERATLRLDGDGSTLFLNHPRGCSTSLKASAVGAGLSISDSDSQPRAALMTLEEAGSTLAFFGKDGKSIKQYP